MSSSLNLIIFLLINNGPLDFCRLERGMGGACSSQGKQVNKCRKLWRYLKENIPCNA
jgi:hypothetical protein